MLNFTQTGQEIWKVWQKVIYSLKYDFHCSNSTATHKHLTKFYSKFHKIWQILLFRRVFLFYSVKNASKQLNLQQLTHYLVHIFRYCVQNIQGESLARDPKLFSMYTVEQRGFLARKYWQTGSFKACQMTFRTEFGERCAPSKCSIQKLVKKLETRGSLLTSFFGAYWRAKCTKIHPTQSNNPKAL